MAHAVHGVFALKPRLQQLVPGRRLLHLTFVLRMLMIHLLLLSWRSLQVHVAALLLIKLLDGLLESLALTVLVVTTL